MSVRPALELVLDDPPPAQAPLIASPVPALDAACGVDFLYPLSAHAPGAKSFTLSSDDGVVVDPSSGELSWTPDRTDKGSHEWTVQVSDGARQDSLLVQVEVQCNEPLRVGCTAAPGGMLALVTWLLLRRRRATSASRQLPREQR